MNIFLKKPYLMGISLWMSLLQGAVAAEKPVEISVGTAIEPSGEVKFLVEAEFDGVQGQGPLEGGKFFWVEAEAAMGQEPADEGGGFELPVAIVKIIPAQFDRVPFNGMRLADGQTLRFFSGQYRRYLDLNIGQSFSFTAIGMAFEKETALLENDKLRGAISFSLDALGLQYTALTTGGQFSGMQLGKVAFETSLAWDMTQALTLEFKAGANTGAGFGHFGNSDQTNFNIDPELFAKLELQVNSLFTEFAVFVEGEYERHDYFGPTNELHNGEFELKIGLAKQF